MRQAQETTLSNREEKPKGYTPALASRLVLILIPPSVGARSFSEQQSIYNLASHTASLQGGNIIYQSKEKADLAFLTAVFLSVS